MMAWCWRRGLVALIVVPLLFMLPRCPAHAQATIGWNRGPWAAAGRIPDTNSYVSSGFVLLATATGSNTDPLFETVTSSAINTTGATVIVVHVAWWDFNTITTTLSDSKGNTCTALTPATLPTSVGSALFVCYAPTVGAGHTFTGSNQYASIEVLAFSGSATATDRQSGFSRHDTTIQPGSTTPLFANELVVTGVANEVNSGAPVTIDSGFTAIVVPYVAGVNEGSALAYKVQTTIAAENPTWNVVNFTDLATSQATIKP